MLSLLQVSHKNVPNRNRQETACSANSCETSTDTFTPPILRSLGPTSCYMLQKENEHINVKNTFHSFAWNITAVYVRCGRVGAQGHILTATNLQCSCCSLALYKDYATFYSALDCSSRDVHTSQLPTACYVMLRSLVAKPAIKSLLITSARLPHFSGHDNNVWYEAYPESNFQMAIIPTGLHIVYTSFLSSFCHYWRTRHGRAPVCASSHLKMMPPVTKTTCFRLLSYHHFRDNASHQGISYMQEQMKSLGAMSRP